SYVNSQQTTREKDGRIHNDGAFTKHGLKPPDFPIQSQAWAFPPGFMLPPHAPPFPPPIDYPRFQPFGRGGKRAPRKSDDNRKPISYKDWDDPNLDN
ncbi:hypothetical protein, partial [Salmonella sp. s51228]|uniref:hypothetical protein n=1 Tax=Salmonella sp. s51228 TaxID=3159652 RepID=UPI00397ED571